MRPMTKATRTKITTKNASTPKMAARTKVCTGRTVRSRMSSTTWPTFLVSCAAQSSRGDCSEDMSDTLAARRLGQPVTDAEASRPGVCADDRPDVVDQDLFSGIDPFQPVEKGLEVRGCGVCHCEPRKRTGVFQLVHEVIERTGACALSRLFHCHAVSNLDDRLYCQQKNPHGFCRSETNSLAGVFSR